MFTSGFIGPHILNFERSLSLAPGPQNSLVPACKISLGGPVCGHFGLLASQKLFDFPVFRLWAFLV
jgi:hypothetical protein